jgi:peptidyl-tRNA hydrolase, PTH1 family
MKKINYYIVGLGNPGEEYKKTRHNAGAMVVEHFREVNSFENWKHDKRIKCLVSIGKVDSHVVTLLLPQNFMNNSGVVSSLIKGKSAINNTIVVYDDIDLSLGRLRISYGRSSGGHNGVESVINALKTRDFLRLRFGIANKGAQGKVKKPNGEKAVIKYLLSEFSKTEDKDFLKTIKLGVTALGKIITQGKEKAMCEFNSTKL